MGDWSSPQYITSQIFVSAAYILLAATYFINNRHKLLLTTITSNITMGVGFILLNAWVAVAMCVIAICRDLTGSIINARRKPEDKLKNSRLDWFLLTVWISAFSIATALTQEGFMTLFAYFATMTFTISIWQKNIFVYKFLGIFVGIFWVIYNVIVNNFMGVALESVLLVFVVIGLISYIVNKKKKLLVYLHGFGFDKNNNKDFVIKLTEKYNAELLILNAPFNSNRARGGYAWYEIQKEPKKHIFDEKVDISANFIIQETDKKLKELGLKWKDVILSGRSQGGIMSMYLALTGKVSPDKVLSICGYYPKELQDRGIKNKKIKIIWVDALNDTKVTQEKKDTFSNLLNAGCVVEHVTDENSDHDNLSFSIIDKL